MKNKVSLIFVSDKFFGIFFLMKSSEDFVLKESEKYQNGIST
ncbi:hypothetical protein FLJC2902T_12600 [Flavobacterium limnosediminis JC2902]|uniref:Uncharacterized protein n=1 Tax=Flavobacterium limnosediminis JC2902 TaxID=1341181 RepID=V6SQF6_9FLAO|nr:hypothetical protein FLJC2902T_12600 [Flavobacterium limnosediminis JC2902]